MGPAWASPGETHVGSTWAPGGPHLGNPCMWGMTGMPIWEVCSDRALDVQWFLSDVGRLNSV